MLTLKKILGNAGETAAAKYLQEKGYLIHDRNWQSNHHEVDIIAQDRKELVFVEVKTRASDQYGRPEDAVDGDKINNLIQAYHAYLTAKPQFRELSFRLDVVSVLGHWPNFQIEHFIDPFADIIAAGKYKKQAYNRKYHSKGYFNIRNHWKN